MATSQTPEPHRHPVADRAPADRDRSDGDPTTLPAAPRTPRRRRTAGHRRTTIDALAPPAADNSGALTVIGRSTPYPAGKAIRTVVPCPGSLLTFRLPWWASMMALAMDKPSPAPWSARVSASGVR